MSSLSFSVFPHPVEIIIRTPLGNKLENREDKDKDRCLLGNVSRCPQVLSEEARASRLQPRCSVSLEQFL
jgi:hypothetical protein